MELCRIFGAGFTPGGTVRLVLVVNRIGGTRWWFSGFGAFLRRKAPTPNWLEGRYEEYDTAFFPVFTEAKHRIQITCQSDMHTDSGKCRGPAPQTRPRSSKVDSRSHLTRNTELTPERASNSSTLSSNGFLAGPSSLELLFPRQDSRLGLPQIKHGGFPLELPLLRHAPHFLHDFLR